MPCLAHLKCLAKKKKSYLTTLRFIEFIQNGKILNVIPRNKITTIYETILWLNPRFWLCPVFLYKASHTQFCFFETISQYFICGFSKYQGISMHGE